MKTISQLIDIYTGQHFGQFENRGQFVNLHVTTKRAQWNKRRNYGL